MPWRFPLVPSNSEPEEIVLADESAVYVYAGRLEDGTKVVRDANGMLHALVPIRITISYS